MSRISKGIAFAGVGLLVMGIGRLPVAQADGTYDRLNANVRHDMDTVKHEEHRIHDMQRKMNDQKASGDYRHARSTARDIDRAYVDLNRDRALLRRDQREFDRYKKNH